MHWGPSFKDLLLGRESFKVMEVFYGFANGLGEGFRGLFCTDEGQLGRRRDQPVG
jgi:hypothetical protein